MAETVCIYGATDSRKTSNIGFAARYLFELSGGKRFRLVSSDGGQYKPIQHLIDVGIVEPLWIPSCKQPLVMYRKLSLGWWPHEIEDGQMIGDVLVAPGGKLKDGTINDLSLICGYGYEGLTSMSDRMMADLRDKQRKIGQDSVGNFVEKLGEGSSAITETFAKNNQSHYGFAQDEMISFVVRCAQLPVLKVIISAHEAGGEEEDSKQPIRGPGLAGKAATGRVLKDLGTVVHFELYNEEVPAKTKQVVKAGVTTTEVIEPATIKSNVRAFYQSHPDQLFSRIKYPAKARVPPHKVADLEKEFPGGYFVPGVDYGTGLDNYIRTEDRLCKEAGTDDSLVSWIKGIKSGAGAAK